MLFHFRCLGTGKNSIQSQLAAITLMQNIKLDVSKNVNLNFSAYVLKNYTRTKERAVKKSLYRYVTRYNHARIVTRYKTNNAQSLK